MATEYIWNKGKYQAVGESEVVRQLKVEVVDYLPSEGSPGVIYIVPSSGPVGEAVGGSIEGTLSNQTDLQTALNQKANTSALANIIAAGINFITTEPTEDNTDGLKVVVLDHEPADRYDGWIYIITE